MKKIFIVLLAVSLSLTLTACGKSDLENYLVAMAKTENMIKASESMSMDLETKFDTEESPNQTSFSLEGSFDKEVGKSMHRGYLNFANLGYDFNIYEIEGSYYLEPFFINLKDKSYVELSREDFSLDENQSIKDLLKKINGKWLEIINEENVMKGERVLITTDAGEVKSREFTITLNEHQLKEFIFYAIDLFEDNEIYMDLLEEITYLDDEEDRLTEEEKKELYKEMFYEAKNFIENTEDLNLFYKAYIDMDNYVVQEDLKFNIGSEDASSKELISLGLTMTNRYWNIEKDQDFNFDIAPEDKSIRLEELDLEEIISPREDK